MLYDRTTRKAKSFRISAHLHYPYGVRLRAHIMTDIVSHIVLFLKRLLLHMNLADIPLYASSEYYRWHTSIRLMLWPRRHAGYCKRDMWYRNHLRHLPVHMCVHVIAFTTAPRCYHHCHYQHDCCGSLQGCKLAEERTDREPRTFWPNPEETHPEKKKEHFVFTFLLLCSPYFFVGLYLLYVYIKQFQIL